MNDKTKRILSILLWSAAIAAAFVCWFYTFYFWFFALTFIVFAFVLLCAVATLVLGVLYFVSQKRAIRNALIALLALAPLLLLITFLFLWTGWCGFHFPP